MALRCFLFSSDEGTSDTIRHVLTGLGVEGESCSEPATSVLKLAQELFQIVVIDWDRQPEAGMLLSAARDRKPGERPLILAVVSDDSSVPKVLQAGANSILKKPLSMNQVADTLTTARDLLRSRLESAQAAQAVAAAAAAAPPLHAVPEPPRPAPPIPTTDPSVGAQFETESEGAHFPEQSGVEQIDPLKDLEPMAAAVAQQPSTAAPSDEPKGLEWYLKARGVVRQPASVFASAHAPAPAPVKESKPELLGYGQTPSSPSPDAHGHADVAKRPEPKRPEAQLFSSVADEEGIAAENPETADAAASRSGLGKKAIAAAVLVAALAIAAAPQAPWHPRVAGMWTRGRHTLLAWLNPQPVTSVSQAPATHEDFARAGDEYKLPVAENIPDATTDPSQISVVPIVDPTKKPAPDAAATNPVAAPDTTPVASPDSAQPSNAPVTTSQPVQPAPTPSQPISVPAATPGTTTQIANPPSDTPTVATPPTVTPAPKRQPTPYVPVTTKVPSSLQSQMAVMTPDAGGNKPVEAALPAIEPVEVSELNERALLADQPPPVYPANAAGKQGTVTLQVLIGRDGSVQDAKFIQGSLAFARAAIDGVKQWKFKPYLVNGRPVSVATSLTLRFAPGQ